MKFREAKKLLNPENNIRIGQILKPHGYKGHVKINLRFDPAILTEESVFAGISGWLIPFFIDYDQSNLTALKPIIKFFDVDDEVQTRELAGKEIFLPRDIAKKYVNLDNLEFLINYTIEDKDTGKIGIITEFLDIEKNPLVKADFDGEEILIPINGTQVLKVSHKKKYVKVVLPPGLLH